MDPRLAQFPPFSVSANPTSSSWVPRNLNCVGGIPEQEGAANAPTSQSRGCLLGGQRRKHCSTCLSGRLHLNEDQRNREKISCDKTAVVDNKPPWSPQQTPETMGTQEGPTDKKHMCRFLQGGYCSSQQLACPNVAGTGAPGCLCPQQRNPFPRSAGDLQPRRPFEEEEKMTPPLTLPLWKDPGAATVSQLSSMVSCLGPTRRGTSDKQLSPAGSSPGLGGSPRAGGAPVRSQSGGRAGSLGQVCKCLCMCPRASLGCTHGRMVGGDGGCGGDQKVRLGRLAGASGHRAWKPLPGDTVHAQTRPCLPASCESWAALGWLGCGKSAGHWSATGT